MEKLNREIQSSLEGKIKKLASKDLRLGQMFVCVFEKIVRDGKDPFFVENSELEKYFDKLVNDK